MRFDQLHSYRDESQISPRINFVWTPVEGATVFGGYARYFTPPPFELVADTTIGKFVGTAAGPALLLDDTPRAERDDYFDLGAKQQLTRTLEIGIDAYDRRRRTCSTRGSSAPRSY